MPIVPTSPAFDRFYVDGLYCALHRSKPEKRRGVCVVISSPVGRDARFTYRCMVIFADALAARGFDVVRFDPGGEGDSRDIPSDADQWTLWSAGLVKVSNSARALTGASQTVLLGLRNGATLARVVAREAEADGLVLLDPLLSGEAWLQELRVIETLAISPKPPEFAIDALGLRLSHATKASVEAVDLAALPPLDIPCLYAAPVRNKAFAASLGRATTAIPFKGYVSFFKEPFLNAYPDATFDVVSNWLIDSFAPQAAVASRSTPIQRQLEGDGYVEEPVFFGAGYYGVVTWPADRRANTAVLIGNTGGDPRAGTGNFASFMARSLARQHITTLRMDFDGFGESDPAHGPSLAIYDTPRTDIFRAAADLLQDQGAGDPLLVGICTGGYHAVQAALNDPRFRKVLAINAWLTVEPGVPLERESFLQILRTKFVDAQPELTLKVEPLIDSARSMINPRRSLAAGSKPEEPAPSVDAPIGPAAKKDLKNLRRALADGGLIRLLVGYRDPSRTGLDEFGEQGVSQLLEQGLEQQLQTIDHGLFSLESQIIVLRHIRKILDVPAQHQTRSAHDSAL